MKTNTKPQKVHTHASAVAGRVGAEDQLRRAVMACLLFEKQFYEDGQSIAQRIAALVPQVEPAKVADIAAVARGTMNLRHVPLLLVREMARHKKYRGFVAATLFEVIQRVDEMAEFLAIYWDGTDRRGKEPLANSVKRGLAAAFEKFGEYDFAKYDGSRNGISLADVMNLVHPHPTKDREALYRQIAPGFPPPAETWEVTLSNEADNRSKAEKWESLLRDRRMGALAILRNLRNFKEHGVDEAVVLNALAASNVSRVLPFQFIAAARHAPQWEPQLETKMFESITGELPGKTVILVDVSGSMDDQLSEKSDMKRLDAAYGVAMIGREMCERVDVYTFSSHVKLLPARRGFALRDAMHGSQAHSSTYLGKALQHINAQGRYDRIIVITR